MTSELNEAFSCVKTVVNHLADDTFVTTSLSQVGAVTGDFIPLFNTVKVDITVAGHGRNDGKFVRGWLHEGVISEGKIDSSVRTAFEGVFSGLITDSTAAGVDLVDLDGNLWLTASVREAIQMRQLHRRRKKVTP